LVVEFYSFLVHVFYYAHEEFGRLNFGGNYKICRSFFKILVRIKNSV